MVIVLILGILVLLVALGAPLSDATVALEQQQRITYARDANYQMARSAVELAMQLLKVDDTDFDSSQDLWAFGNQRLSWEGKNMWLEIRDEDSRFPIGAVTNVSAPGGALANTTNTTGALATANVTAANTTSNSTATAGNTSNADQDFYSAALARLVDRAGLPKEAVATLQDWVDSDEQVRDGGAEQGAYSQYRCKNGPLDSVEEVYLISRWGSPSLPPPEPLQPGSATLAQASAARVPVTIPNSVGGPPTEVQSLPGGSDWSDWLTLWSGGKINLNTAPREILRCLDASMTDSILQEFIATRSQKVLKSQEDLKKIPGIDPDLAFRLSKVGGFNSKYFRIRVVVDEQPGRLALEAIVQRSTNKKLKVVFWRLF